MSKLPNQEPRAHSPRNWRTIAAIAGASATSAAALFAGNVQAKTTGHEVATGGAKIELAGKLAVAGERGTPSPGQEKGLKVAMGTMTRLKETLETIKHSNQAIEYFGALVINANKSIFDYNAPYRNRLGTNISSSTGGGLDPKYNKTAVITNPIIVSMYGQKWVYGYMYNAKVPYFDYPSPIPNALVDDLTIDKALAGKLSGKNMTKDEIARIKALTLRGQFYALDDLQNDASLEYWGFSGFPPKMLHVHSPDGETLVQTDHNVPPVPIAGLSYVDENYGFDKNMGTVSYQMMLKQLGYSKLPGSYKPPF
ncbi:MAG TPA: hypothetical protein VMT23_01975 [Candidatus Binatia bacterium]|nr:hypothetical protein [Candidatus Binatia bacterium]